MPAIATAASTNNDGVWQRAGEAALVAAEQERAARNIPSIAVGIVTRDGLVWSGGVGHADAEGKVPVDASTVYRIGGLTQAFTAELVRSLATSGKLDLDAPVTRYLPSFQPRNTFGGEITLRQLLEHRSGLVRMPPRGHHADLDSATLAETVTSLNATALVSKPGSAVKYSDAGYAVLAHVLEVVGGKPFDQLLADTVFTPRSMARTSVRADKKPLAQATMAPFDGERFAPAVFDTGVAASMGAQSNVKDLARFAQDLLGREAATLGGERGVLDRHDLVSLSGGGLRIHDRSVAVPSRSVCRHYVDGHRQRAACVETCARCYRATGHRRANEAASAGIERQATRWLVGLAHRVQRSLQRRHSQPRHSYRRSAAVPRSTGSGGRVTSARQPSRGRRSRGRRR